MSTKYISGRKKFINEETGETIEGMVKIEHIEREQFDIIYLMKFCDIFESIGGKKYLILKYLLVHRSLENTIIATQREIAKECNCSVTTVTETLKILKNAGIINIRTGAIIFNPHIIVNGTKKKEDWIFTKFISFDK